MIKIKVGKYISSEEGMFADVIASIHQALADTTGKELKNKIGHLYCEKHPDFKNILLVTPKEKALGIKVVDICCDEFKKTISPILR